METIRYAMVSHKQPSIFPSRGLEQEMKHTCVGHFSVWGILRTISLA